MEGITPIEGNKIRLYTCGPTVYNFAHIGNCRTYIFEDLLRRTLKYFGFEVEQVMNITDLDDKTIQGATQQQKPLKEFTQPFIDAFFEDLRALNIEKVEHYPCATEYIPKMIEIIEALIEKKIAYPDKEGSIYFSIAKFPEYGKLSHLKLDELKVGATSRVTSDEYNKENISDFVLWKAYDPVRDGDVFWESPFGNGRPGWHIECSTMAMDLLGETIDIHVGGVDNIFPHHENEIAQSQAYTGKRFANLWLHSAHLLVNHKKMSKSLGNFFTLRDLLKMGYSPQQVRYLLLNSHYRMSLNFTLQGLEAAGASLERLSDFVFRLERIDTKIPNDQIDQILLEAKRAFDLALSDDLNLSLALAALFEMVRKINALYDAAKLGEEQAKKTLNFLKEIDTVLGIIFFEEKKSIIPKDLLEALQKREDARKVKNFAEADKQRDYITNKGYLIEDTPSGPRLKKSKH